MALSSFIGSRHSHCSLSDGSGTPEMGFTAARANGMDWWGISPHVFILPMDLTRDRSTTIGGLAHLVSVTGDHTEEGEFIALSGVEWTRGLHMIIENAQHVLNMQPVGLGPDDKPVLPDTEIEMLRLAADHAAPVNISHLWLNAVPNEPRQRFAQDGVEHVFEAVQSADVFGVPGFRPLFSELVGMGVRVGATGCNDDHSASTHGAGGGGGFTVAWMESLTAQNLHRAMRMRRTAATMDPCIRPFIRCGAVGHEIHPMGREVIVDAGAGLDLSVDLIHGSGYPAYPFAVRVCMNGYSLHMDVDVSKRGDRSWSHTGQIGAPHGRTAFHVEVYRAEGAWPIIACSSPIWVIGKYNL